MTSTPLLYVQSTLDNSKLEGLLKNFELSSFRNIEWAKKKFELPS